MPIVTGKVLDLREVLAEFVEETGIQPASAKDGYRLLWSFRRNDCGKGVKARFLFFLFLLFSLKLISLFAAICREQFIGEKKGMEVLKGFEIKDFADAPRQAVLRAEALRFFRPTGKTESEKAASRADSVVCFVCLYLFYFLN